MTCSRYDFASLPVLRWIFYSVESTPPVACGHSCYKAQVPIGLRLSKHHAVGVKPQESLSVGDSRIAVRLIVVLVMIVRGMADLADVDHRQQGKYKRLNESHKDTQTRKG